MMRFCFALLGLTLLAASAWAAQPIVLQARTAGDLAALCATEPTSPGADAKINFCHGFPQGAADDRLHMATGAKPFCFPNPPPTRTATARDFVTWARTTPAAPDLPVLRGLFKFLG